MSIGHGGQVLVSAVTAELARETEFELRDLGEHRLAGLSRAERVSELCPAGLVHEFPPLRTLDASPGNLPRQMTSFVGRKTELVTLTNLVRARTLVTLTGVGGVGKTRLALEVAAGMIGEFADGAWLCELAPVSDPDAVWDTLAATLKVPPVPGRTIDEVLLDYLAAKHLLLLLDNCEHLLDAAADVVKAIERRCRQVMVLATSREGIAVPGEQIVAVPSLTVPATDADAEQLRMVESVRLFCERASSVKRDFEPAGHVLGSVGVLCRRLDGIPLAIELAAARSASLAPEDLVARLDQRFKLLARGSRASLERHQTLRNTIDWSYDLLGHTERDALQRLSVFAGGGDLMAAEGVLTNDDLDEFDVVDVVGQLVDKSLVVAEADGDGHLRYRMLESIRQYAQERLEASGNAALVRARHADYDAALAESAGPKLRSREQIETARRMARETDNFRLVLDWAVDTASPDTALRMVAPLAIPGIPTVTRRSNGRRPPPRSPEPATARSSPTWPRGRRGPRPCATTSNARSPSADLVDETQAARGERRPSACQGPTTLAFFRGDVARARERAEEWVELGRSTGEPFDIAHTLIMFAAAQQAAGASDLAVASYREAVRIARDAGIPSALSIGLASLSTSLPIEDADHTLALLEEAIDVSTQIGDRTALIHAISMKGWITAYRGDHLVALEAAVDNARRQLQTGDFINAASPLHLGAVALAHLDHPEHAAVLDGVGWRLIAGEPPSWGVQLVTVAEAKLIAQLGPAEYEALRARGADLSPADALAHLISVAQVAST